MLIKLRNLRSGNAAASLKQGGLESLVEQRGKSPQRKRCGLIEAPGNSGMRDCLLNLRSGNAAASLKRSGQKVCIASLEDLRSGNAAASLKRDERHK
jgi:hypothetical protein